MSRLRSDVTVLTLARLVTNGGLRFTPPFLSSVAASLGVSVGAVGAALSVSEAAGLAAPAVGSRIDRSSHRLAMVVGLGLVTVAAVIGATSATILQYAAALTAISLAKIVYDASMGAWVAERVPYARRARVTGFVETAWAGSYLLAIPVLAVIAEVSSWRVSLGILAVASLVFAVVVRRRLEPDHPPAAVAADRARLVGLRRTLPVFVGLGLLMAASQSVIVVFGVWLVDDLGWSTAAVGAVAFAIGFGELGASVTTMKVTDRLGKRRAVVLGATVMVPTALALGALADRAGPGVVLLVVFVMGFEFALVSSLPLVSELHPEARAKGIGIGFGAGTVGRGVGAAMGAGLYGWVGLRGATMFAAAAAGGVVAVVGLLGGRAEAAARGRHP